MTMDVKYECQKCGNELPLDFNGRCPTCGNITNKNVKASFSDKIGLVAFIAVQLIRKYRKYNPIILALNVILIVASLLISYFFITDRNWALIIGILAAIFSFILGLYMCVNVIEITKIDSNNIIDDSSKKVREWNFKQTLTGIPDFKCNQTKGSSIPWLIYTQSFFRNPLYITGDF